MESCRGLLAFGLSLSTADPAQPKSWLHNVWGTQGAQQHVCRGAGSKHGQCSGQLKASSKNVAYKEAQSTLIRCKRGGDAQKKEAK